MAIGIVTDKFSEQAKPAEFGNSGENWSNVGWIVPIEWRLLSKPFAPKSYISQISSLLPIKYSPITRLGDGNQKCYLAQISKPLADVLFLIINSEDGPVLDEIEYLEVEAVTTLEVLKVLRADLELTEKEQLVKARLGQGLFRQKLIRVERQCRLTGISDLNFLVASHIKPWRVSNNEERQDGNNGLFLSPHVDRLFDRGWISFEDDGSLMISGNTSRKTMELWRLNQDINVGSFNEKQKQYLAYHRANIFKSH